MDDKKFLAEEVVRLIDESEPAIRSAMRGFSQDDIDDVKQETWIQINRSLAGLKDTRNLAGWVYKTARNKAHDHVRKINAERRKNEHFEHMSTGREQSPVSLDIEDFSHNVDSRQTASEMLSELMPRVESLMANRVTCARAVELITRYYDDVADAARAMAVSESVVRDARREFVRCALTISRALELRAEHPVLTRGILLECMPSGVGESGTWIREIMEHILNLGGPAKATVAQLMERTGKQANTVRQYKAEAEHLASVVATIFAESNDRAR